MANELQKVVEDALARHGATPDLLGMEVTESSLMPNMDVAVAIKLDSPGPVLFRQRRHGLNRRDINVLKFRSMTVMENGGEVRQASVGDARVTRIGAFLRRTSLDELPQLINVLAGEMSLIGPRPHALVHDDHYGEMLERYANRHQVKPGMTGWAQVCGFRGPTETPDKMQARVACDLVYIDRWSLWFDLKILAMTVFVGLMGVLIQAKQKHFIKSVREMTTELERVADFHLSEEIKSIAYRKAGEL